MEKQKMSGRTFRAIMVPVMAVLLAVLIAGNVLMNVFSGALETYIVGSGSRVVTGGSGLDTEYVKNLYKDADNPNRAAMEAAQEVSRRVAGEGMVLLKNGTDGAPILPLAEGSAVTPFGYRFLWPCYTQFGSTTMYGGFGFSEFAKLMGNTGPQQTLVGDHVVDPLTALKSNFTVNEKTVELMKGTTVMKVDAAPGTIPCQEVSPQNCNGGNTYLYEYDPAVYASAAPSMAGTVGLVFIGRDGGEGGDLKVDGYADGTRHQLALSENEKKTIALAKANCAGVVAVINSNNVMELGELAAGPYEADAILWVGTPGSIGFQAMSDILCGKVVPSGRTVSSWPYDLTKDPTYVNMFAAEYSNVQCHDSAENPVLINVPYVEYEEGIYVDYRYYETAAVEDAEFDFDAEVLYPFGYGLSYADIDGGFRQEITSVVREGNRVTVEVEVTNNSTQYAGKDVVELYYTAPYTAFDVEYRIEKAAVNLLDFEKTGVIAPGASEKVTFTFCEDDMASYCYTRDNGDGTQGAYVLEKGDYNLSVRSDSHRVQDEYTLENPATIWYDSANPRQSEKDGQSALDENGIPTGAREDGGAFIAAANRFEDMTRYMEGQTVRLTRSDWKNTFPTRPAASKAAPEDVVKDIETYSWGFYDCGTDPLLGNLPGSLVYNNTPPAANAGNGVSYMELRGASYHDSRWEQLLDNLDYSEAGLTELRSLFFVGSYNVSKITALSFLYPATIFEGPDGIGAFSRTHLPASTVVCTYPTGMLQASTWNKELVYEVGAATAQEFMNAADEPVNGWAGPSMNSQRSPFSGRNGEYYSVDPVLSGKIGCSVIEGAADNGLFAIFKHLAMNDLETNRHSICVWADEQTVREQYLKTFEIVMKEGRKTVRYIDSESNTLKSRVMKASMTAMTTMTRMGAIPTGGSYALQTGVVRGEWGFQGFILTDMPTQTDCDLLLRSGGDIQLTSIGYKAKDMTSNTMKNLMREGVHHILYAVVNSNYMNGLEPSVEVAQSGGGIGVLLVIWNVAFGLPLLCCAVWFTVRTLDEKKHPERYLRKGGKADGKNTGI